MSRKNKNIIFEKVLVENYAAEGRSLGRVNGKVIFIEDVVPGDIVDVRVGRNKKDWAEGYPVYVHQLSEDRVVPFCQHFGVCGGCQWQMLPYEKQLTYKQQQVQDNLQRIGKISMPPVLPIIGASRTVRYRNKIEYTFSNKKFLLAKEIKDISISATENVAGFHAKGIYDKVVDIWQCHLQEEPTNSLRLAVKQFAIDHSFSFYDIKQHSGLIRTMQVRICESGEIMVNLVFGHQSTDQINALLDHLLLSFPQITTLLFTINSKWNDSLNDLLPQVYSGPGYITEKLGGFNFKIGPKSFFQTNTLQAEQLYRVVFDFAELSGNETVYDLYCGTGSIGIFISTHARKVIGVDVIPEAIGDARENALLNNISHTDFFTGDVIDICSQQFFQEHGKPDVIITDPPRAGMHEKLVQKILDIAAPIVVYVSCNPATQARDLNLLSSKYYIKKIQPVDMFPHTHHIENVVQLKLTD